MITRFLFPKRTSDFNVSFALLLLRIVVGALFMTHGWAKLTNFEATAAGFEQMGTGGAIGAGLAVFAEFFCGIGIITGFLFRLALIPPIVTMSVAFFFVHGGSPAEGELACVYLAVFVAMMFTGAGRFSVDRYIADRLK
ncbi:DoxX family protein [Dysgonomonas sp. 25]|uniref:DoxX family protein n=1 Tax=Dysgonomonas sp. 25 TaxID=2302933 RepID=UPI0013D52EA7|nr:DoxX family protein [Dysgonomonas sp. 25]NDV69306.1 DoxX family protein [Dysgonomonas sp. 25]